ncbi:MAG: RsmE family RNA methyltransferase [Microcoleaceae cyanobacterium]
MSQLQRLAIAPQQIQNRHIDLTAEQQHYLGRVLRLQVGDCFIAIDGQGQGWLVQLVCPLPALNQQAEILKPFLSQTELPITITLLTALPKGNRFEEILRICTELGVGCFVPILSERTLLRPSSQKLERWRKIVTEAAEQSERQIIPTVLDPIPFNAALEKFQTHPLPPNHKGWNYICVARQISPHLLNSLQVNLEQERLKSEATLPLECSDIGADAEELTSKPKTFTPLNIVLTTGPEGGWTTAEVELALELGFQAVSLGQRILRATTAPIMAVSIVSSVLEQ